MSFQQGLSGLSAASTQLDTIGNNIANANTVGFKKSRAEFADLYSSSLYGLSSTTAGIGAQVLSITQNMSGGSMNTTERSMDLAIAQGGFFTLKHEDGSLAYTRNGEFQINNQGYMVNRNGGYLQGWGVNSLGEIVQGPVANIQLNTGQAAPTRTGSIKLGVNLDSRASPPKVTTFDPAKPDSFNWSNTSTVYDSLGIPHQLVMYYVAGTATTSGNSWTVHTYIDGDPVNNSTGTPNTYTLNFDTYGKLTNTANYEIVFSPNPVNGAEPNQKISIDFTGSTQVGQASGVTIEPVIDGSAPGELKGITITDKGIIQAMFTTGQKKTIGQIALANFVNLQGLQPIGVNQWTSTNESGNPSFNAPGSGNVGTVLAGTLETSNVDLTRELVNMITSQRYYQANVQTIKTQDSLMQTLLNM